MRVRIAEDDTALASFVRKGLESELVRLRARMTEPTASRGKLVRKAAAAR